MPEMRSSVRFPLHLTVAVRAHEAERQAETVDISAGGVLLEMDGGMDVGSNIEFTIFMPAGRLGSRKDVLVSCVGRVVRCSSTGERSAVAAVIEDYRIVR
jgi:PilZ domain